MKRAIYGSGISRTTNWISSGGIASKARVISGCSLILKLIYNSIISSHKLARSRWNQRASSAFRNNLSPIAELTASGVTSSVKSNGSNTNESSRENINKPYLSLEFAFVLKKIKNKIKNKKNKKFKK